MAYIKSIRRNFRRQKSNTYILFMIVGSYFRRCVCKAPVCEQNLYLYYKEEEAGRQIKEEEKVISYIEKNFEDKLGVLANLDCEVHIERTPEKYLLIFYTGFEGMIAVVDRRGDYRIEYYDMKSGT